jgi:hypothetical protein
MRSSKPNTAPTLLAPFTLAIAASNGGPALPRWRRDGGEMAASVAQTFR